MSRKPSVESMPRKDSKTSEGGPGLFASTAPSRLAALRSPKSDSGSLQPAPASTDVPKSPRRANLGPASANPSTTTGDFPLAPALKKRVEFPARSPNVIPASEPSQASGAVSSPQGVARKGSFFDQTLPQQATQRSRTELPPKSPVLSQPPKSSLFPGARSPQQQQQQQQQHPPSYTAALDNTLGSRNGELNLSVRPPVDNASLRSGASDGNLQKTSSVGSLGAKKLSQGSMISQGMPLPARVETGSVVLDGASDGRPGSRHSSFSSNRGRNLPELQMNVDAMSVASHDSIPVDYQQENARLRAQVESLQRLMKDQALAHKVKILQEEVGTRARKIQQLEKDKRDLRDEVAKLKADGRKSSRKSRDAGSMRSASLALLGSRRTSNVSTAEREAAPSFDATSFDRRLKPRDSRGGDINPEQVTELQENVCHLRQHMAEKDVALRTANEKLEKAQDALIAGISWEKEVKLTETRKALKTLLKRSLTPSAGKSIFGSPMPERASPVPLTPPGGLGVAAFHSLSPSMPPYTHAPIPSFPLPNVHAAHMRSITQPVHPPVLLHADPIALLPSTRVPVIDVGGKEVIYAVSPDGLVKHSPAYGTTSPPIAHLVYIPGTGELRDASGSVFLSSVSRTGATLEHLAALCDRAGCRHNLAGQGRQTSPIRQRPIAIAL